jgi:uncharacterized protein (TIGR03083 family)
MTDSPHLLDRSEYIRRIGVDAERIVAVTEQAGPDAVVRTCPGWTVRDAVLHQGEVHRWATIVVRDELPKPLLVPADHLGALPDDAGLVTWFRDGVSRLTEVLTAAPDGLEAFRFLTDPPAPALFWARRQAHETGMHRVDVESAIGGITGFDAAVAVDGIDEIITGFTPRKHVPLHADPARTMRVETTDSDAVWHLTIGPETPVAVRASKPADCVVRGPASDLFLALWNRQDERPL